MSTALALACAEGETPTLRPPGAGASGGAGGSSAGSPPVGGTAGTTAPTAGTGGTVTPTAGTGGVGGSAGSAGNAGSAGSGGTAGGGSGGGGTAGTGGGSACEANDTECILATALVHRYSFDGSGPAVADSVGDADGTAVGSPTFGAGELTLSGTDQYVDLPDDLLSGLTDATFEAWVTWSDASGGDWQRIFDFGSSDMAQQQGTGETYLFVTPQAGTAPDALRVAYTTSGPSGEALVNDDAALSTGSEHVIAVVVDETAHELRLYLDGASVGSAASLPASALSGLTYENNWLGRSQFSDDPELEGISNEFRVYDVALTATQLQASYDAGPNPAFLDQ